MRDQDGADANEHDYLSMLLTGLVVRVEYYEEPTDMVVLVFLDGRRITLTASDDILVIGEENLPTC